MTVVRSRRCRRLISVRMVVRSLASRLESGSSKRKTWGLRTIARPIATRWRSPPESCEGCLFSLSCSPSTAAASETRASISGAGVFTNLRPNDRFSRTVICG